MSGSAEVVPHRSFDGPPPPRAPQRKKSRRRLNTRVRGGNWKGLPYLSYAEHDRCTRAGMAAISDMDTAAYHATCIPGALRREFAQGYQAERAAIVASRA
jgi:hypothetical protein